MGTVEADVADRCAAAAPAVAVLAARSARVLAEVVSGVPCVDLGVGTPWSAQAYLMAEPTHAAVAAAAGWLDRQGGGILTTRRALAGSPALTGWAMAADLAVMALPATRELPAPLRHGPEASEGPAIMSTQDPELAVEAFGAGFGDPALGAVLVDAAHFGLPDWVHLVATCEGRAVGGAMVRVALGTACVSAVGVAPDLRRRGLGAALTGAAVRAGRAAGADLVWLLADRATRGWYASLGFVEVDGHPQLRRRTG